MCRPADYPPYDETTDELVERLYPELNERGHANYVAILDRLHTQAFQDLVAARRARNECLTQPRIRQGEPWKSDCLVHGVPESMAHHFEVNPNASTD